MKSLPLSINQNIAYFESQFNMLSELGDCTFEKKSRKHYNYEQNVPLLFYTVYWQVNERDLVVIDVEILDNQFNNSSLFGGAGMSHVKVHIEFKNIDLPDFHIEETGYFKKLFGYSGLFKVKSKNKDCLYSLRNDKNLYKIYTQSNDLPDYSPVVESKNGILNINFHCRITAKIEMIHWYQFIKELIERK